MDNTIIKKLCSECHIRIPITLFHKTKTGMYGVAGKCKECMNKKSRARYARDGGKRTKIRAKEKETHHGQLNRSFVAEKKWSHRARFKALEDAGIDVDFRGTDEENTAHANKINEVLKQAGLGDIRNDSKSALQQSLKDDGMPRMQEA